VKINLSVLKCLKTNIYVIYLVLFITFFHSISLASEDQFGYAFDSNGQVIVDSFGNCVRTGSQSQSDIKNKCGFKTSPRSEQVSNVSLNVDADIAVNKTNDIEEMPTMEEQETRDYQSFSTEIKFHFDKYEITKLAKSELDSFIQKTKIVSFRVINILGHADALGANNYNIQLSVKRAKSVENYLINKGVSKNKINTTGLGESKPIADNNTREGRAENRRVLIELE
jgi:outer membrane protein OmpA-like peptidoglycan-associated protein